MIGVAVHAWMIELIDYRSQYEAGHGSSTPANTLKLFHIKKEPEGTKS